MMNCFQGDRYLFICRGRREYLTSQRDLVEEADDRYSHLF